MKVKIGNKIYCSTKEPIMIILDDSDKKNIRDMDKTHKKYCSYPKRIDEKIIKKFMCEGDN